MNNVLHNLGNIPVTAATLRNVLPNRNSFAHYISSKELSREIIRLKQGLYVVSPDVSGKPINNLLIANSLYGPSYVSFQTALGFYGLIDDVVQTTISASFRLNKQYDTPVGRFEYIQLPSAYYPIGITQAQSENMPFLIASPEKALCDLIIRTPKLLFRSKKDVITYLEDDLRFDTESLFSMDISVFQACAEKGYKSTSIQQLINVISQ